MDAFKELRARLELTQVELADLLEVSQGTISFYENGKTIPPVVASRLIDIAKGRGVEVSFDDIYADVDATDRVARVD